MIILIVRVVISVINEFIKPVLKMSGKNIKTCRETNQVKKSGFVIMDVLAIPSQTLIIKSYSIYMKMKIALLNSVLNAVFVYVS